MDLNLMAKASKEYSGTDIPLSDVLAICARVSVLAPKWSVLETSFDTASVPHQQFHPHEPYE